MEIYTGPRRRFIAGYISPRDSRSDLGTASEVTFINDSPPVSSLPEETDQQRRSNRINRSDLSETARKTLGVAALPLGLTNIAATFQDALRGKFIDQV